MFCSCEKDELPVTKHSSGSLITACVNMDPSYQWQIYYSLKSGEIVSSNYKTEWDLAFENGSQGWRVVVNTSKAMSVCRTNKVSMSDVIDTIGFAMHERWDVPSGNLDSTAIGNWRELPGVILINRGYNEAGVHLGYKKVLIRTANSTGYVIEVSNITGAVSEISFAKNEACNFTYLTLESNTTIQVEPPKESWDLVFTQYIHLFKDPFKPYLVTGCLLNPYHTQASLCGVSFDAVTFDDAKDMSLSQSRDVIGYNWKEFLDGTYITHHSMIYVIRDQYDILYKLRFIDFYSPTGLKGNPTWEYVRL